MIQVVWDHVSRNWVHWVFRNKALLFFSEGLFFVLFFEIGTKNAAVSVRHQ